MLSFCLLKYQRVAVDVYPGGAEAPVLFDSDTDTELRDAEIILTYLAREYDIQWMPQEHAQAVARWLAFAVLELAALNEARRIAAFGATGDLAAAVRKGRSALRVLEDALTERSLSGSDWLVGDRASIADIAVFPAVALSHDSGVGHEDYPAINLWQRRMRKLRGIVGMPGVPENI